MNKKNVNRRGHNRIKLEQNSSIPVQIFPELPFIGQTIPSRSLNLSSGGMALQIISDEKSQQIKAGTRLKIHFRIPGHALQECLGKVSHRVEGSGDTFIIGIKFTRIPKALREEIDHMALDNQKCDARIREEENPWCLPTCAFYSLCRKPLRNYEEPESPEDLGFEISLQKAS